MKDINIIANHSNIIWTHSNIEDSEPFIESLGNITNDIANNWQAKKSKEERAKNPSGDPVDQGFIGSRVGAHLDSCDGHVHQWITDNAQVYDDNGPCDWCRIRMFEF